VKLKKSLSISLYERERGTFPVIARPFEEGRGNLILITGVYLNAEIATSLRLLAMTSPSVYCGRV
jgi:hypothetical protein